jgi:6-phosphogluconolactonase
MKLRTLFILPATVAATLAGYAGSSYELYVGTYTPKGGASHGIYTVRFDPATGALGEPKLAAEMRNPSFLALRPDGQVLYALDESGGTGGGLGGGVAAFAVDSGTGGLKLLNRQPTTGASTAHLAIDASARMVVTASYTGGQVAAFPLRTDGSLGAHTAWLLPAGALGPRSDRQERPHPHSITFSPDNRFAYVCDLGLDKIFCYRVDPAAAALVPGPMAAMATAPGAGPRHSVFSADGRFFYVINELNCTIAVYRCDAPTGRLTAGPTISTLPTGFTGQSTCAEIQLHPNGRFIYGSNRGHDSIAVFARDPATGSLTPVEIVSCGGRHPRHFALSPDGEWLICANRDTDDLVVFKVNSATGRLTATGQTARVPQAVCVVFAPAR